MPTKFNPSRKPPKLTAAAVRRIYTTARNRWKADVQGGKKGK
jgi:hypothetical protein